MKHYYILVTSAFVLAALSCKEAADPALKSSFEWESYSVDAMAFDEKTQTLFASGHEAPAVLRWSVGKKQEPLVFLKNRAADLRLASAGDFLTIIAGNRTVSTYDTATSEKLGELTDPEQLIIALRPIENNDFAIGKQPDCSGLARLTPEGKIVQGPSLRSGKLCASRLGVIVGQDVITPLVDTQTHNDFREEYLGRWDTATGRLKSKTPTNQLSIVFFQVSPDRRLLAASGKDHTIRIWQLNDMREIRKIHTGKRESHALLFTANSKYLLIGGWGGQIRAFSVSDWQERSLLNNPSRPILTIQANADCTSVILGLVGGIQIYDFSKRLKCN